MAGGSSTYKHLCQLLTEHALPLCVPSTCTRLCLHCQDVAVFFPSSPCILPPVVVVGCVVYAYAWVVAALVWGFFWWRAGTSSFSFLHTLCMYGYSLSGYNLYLVSHWVGPISAVMYLQYVDRTQAYVTTYLHTEQSQLHKIMLYVWKCLSAELTFYIFVTNVY